MPSSTHGTPVAPAGWHRRGESVASSICDRSAATDPKSMEALLHRLWLFAENELDIRLHRTHHD